MPRLDRLEPGDPRIDRLDACAVDVGGRAGCCLTKPFPHRRQIPCLRRTGDRQRECQVDVRQFVTRHGGTTRHGDGSDRRGRIEHARAARQPAGKEPPGRGHESQLLGRGQRSTDRHLRAFG